ncbi:MAG: NAD(P)/FAD-dependent oxidoreductase, partial [Clostridia bacterium]|nr:NAD(P)/FAD-dependent oxidoreductase [Clostridia bacterium]
NLYRLGIDDIVVIEKFAFPRYKCCAGYITNKTKTAYEKLGLNLDECHYSLIKDFNILYNSKKRLNIINKFLYTNEKIDRVELDDAFFRLAKDEGIEVFENCAIIAHDMQNNSIKTSDGRELKYEYLVFADGATGFGSRYQKNKKRNIALQMTFESNKEESIDIHFGVTERGYCWVSTYGGITNVGMTDKFVKARDYKKIFSDFSKSQGFDIDTAKLTSAMTPIGVGYPIVNKNIMFVGDAAGACDPLTLSGLRYGLTSGEYCAKSIASSKPIIYKRWIRKLKIKFAFMKFMQKVFYLKPTLGLIFNFLCRCFGKFVSRVFNNFFVNKK